MELNGAKVGIGFPGGSPTTGWASSCLLHFALAEKNNYGQIYLSSPQVSSAIMTFVGKRLYQVSSREVIFSSEAESFLELGVDFSSRCLELSTRQSVFGNLKSSIKFVIKNSGP